MEDKTFPDPIPQPLLNGLRKVLGGLEKIVVKSADLVKALTDLIPCEVGKMQQTLNAFFDKRIGGKDPAKPCFVEE